MAFGADGGGAAVPKAAEDTLVVAEESGWLPRA
jgi:hypothetical protein